MFVKCVYEVGTVYKRKDYKKKRPLYADPFLWYAFFMKQRLPIVLAAVIFTVGTWLVLNQGPVVIPLTIGGTTLYVEIADTDEERGLGLGGRENLDEDAGMFYVFPGQNFYAFNMKDMLFPLDIIWINKDKKIVDVMKNVPPETYPEFSYMNDFLAQYVLEVNAGFFDAYGLKVGDYVEFELEGGEAR